MNSTHPSQAPTAAKPAYVYLAVVQQSDNAHLGRFKIGVSVDPQVRLKTLVDSPAINWHISVKRRMSSPSRALQVESALHKALAPLRLSPGHYQDGYTEWFDLSALGTARALLETLPDDGVATALRSVRAQQPVTNPFRRLRSRPTRDAKHPGPDSQCVAGRFNLAQLRATLHLWRRLAWLTTVQVQPERANQAARLVVRGFRHGVMPPGHALRMALMGGDDRYALSAGNGADQPADTPRALVARVGYLIGGADLEIVLQPLARLAQLPAGGQMVKQLKGGLTTLQAVQRARRVGWLPVRRPEDPTTGLQALGGQQPAAIRRATR